MSVLDEVLKLVDETPDLTPEDKADLKKLCKAAYDEEMEGTA